MNRRCLLGSLGAVFASLVGCSTSSQPQPQPTGNVYKVQGSELVITADDNHGAAIYSLVWNGVEFVNSFDRGREIQTAYQCNGLGEGFNPTECGQAGPVTQPGATRVLSASVAGKVFTSSVNPAFWNPVNGQVTSPDIISKTVTVDYNGVTNLVRHDVTVVTAQDYASCVMAGLTGYLNSQFNTAYMFDGTTLTPTTVENWGNTPLILATPDGKYAMGVFSQGHQYVLILNIGGSGSNDWNAAMYGITPCPKGSYSHTVYYVVGTLADVQAKLSQVITSPPNS